jgi:hypothetical protein
VKYGIIVSKRDVQLGKQRCFKNFRNCEGNMMFKENNDHKQMNLLDNTNWMDPIVAKKFSKTWAPIFYEHVFCKIDEKPFGVLYSDIGCPNFPVNILLGLEYIKHLFNYTDDELIQNFYFNYLVSYALGVRNLGDKNLAERTLYYFRERVYKYTLEHPEEDDLISQQFSHLTDGFIKACGISTKEQRMDSTLIASNIKKAGRLSLAVDVLEQAVKALPEEILSSSLKEVLTSNFRTNTLYRIKANETASKLGSIIDLINEVNELITDNPEFESLNVIKILKRFLTEQAEYDTEEKRYKPKDKAEIPADSLQSAYDEDATYRVKGDKRGSGYAVNITETCSESNDTQFITDYDTAPNIKSDVKFIKERLPKITEKTDCEHMYTDGGYYSPEVIELAKEEGVTMHYTDMTGRKPSPDKLSVTDFQFDESSKRIISCPKGKEPIKNTITKDYIAAHFNREICSHCEFRDKCLVKRQKKSYVVQINHKAIVSAEQRVLIKENIKERTSKRAAIEGTNSALKRAHGIGKLRVRSLNKCSIVVGLKITAHNFKRFMMCTFRKAKETMKPKGGGISMPIYQ